MFSSILWKKKNKLPENEKLAKVKELLFPQYTTESLPNGDLFHVDSSVDSNLDAALVDLQTGANDKMIQATISNVIEKLRQAREILGVEQEINPDARAIVFEILKDGEIEANEK